MWRSSHGPIGKAVAGWSFPCLARRRPVEFRSVILAVELTADSDADHAIGNAASCAGSSPTGSFDVALVEQDSKVHTALGERSKKGPQESDFQFLAERAEWSLRQSHHCELPGDLQSGHDQAGATTKAMQASV